MKKKVKKGKQFETAVYEFVKKLSPSSKVWFDHKVLDRDTGSKRQIDAWVETIIADHYPISILISCKDYTRKVNISHIDTFINEVRSTGASTGIIYSRSGFTQTAIKKAEVNGLNCCRLYENSLADTPELLVFSAFCSLPQFQLRCWDIPNGAKTWGDLFQLKYAESDQLLSDILLQELQRLQSEVKSKYKLRLPDVQTSTVSIEVQDGTILTVAVNLGFRHFEARQEAHLVNGSYCINNNSFIGSVVLVKT